MAEGMRLALSEIPVETAESQHFIQLISPPGVLLWCFRQGLLWNAKQPMAWKSALGQETNPFLSFARAASAEGLARLSLTFPRRCRAKTCMYLGHNSERWVLD